MEPINLDDLVVVNNLSSRTYTDNKLLSNATEKEKTHLREITNKLKVLANYFSGKYNQSYGPFETSVTTGNAIAIGGTNFKRVWSGIFKGAENKQYAAQISFVMNPRETCADVGFYFGRASGHSFDKEQRTTFEDKLDRLGISLSSNITNNELLQAKYNSLFDFGFKSYYNGKPVLADEWIINVQSKPKNSHIIAKIFPNDFNIVEYSTIDSYVSQVIFLMGAISSQTNKNKMLKPLTPQQRAKQAERFSQIGLKGELYVMKYENERLEKLSIKIKDYPRHVALESMSYGYDILSKDESLQDIYIEVKTTTRTKEDKDSKQFFISANEFEVFSDNKQKYRLYRVYDIENSPSLELLDLGQLNKRTDGFIVEY